MPFVKIELWEGRTEEQKEKMIKAVTEALEQSIGVPAEHTQIAISEYPRTNWGISGKQASKIEGYNTSVKE
jgi:4-oxalocrotonate tautomerase